MKRLLTGLQSPWDKASPFLSTSLLTTAFFPLSLSAAGVLTQPLQLARPASLFWAQNVPRDAHSTHSCRAPYSVLGTQRGLRDVAGLGRTFFSHSANTWPLSERQWGQVLGLLLGYVLATLVWCRYICLSVCVAVGSPSPLETLAPVDLVHSMELEKGALGEMNRPRTCPQKATHHHGRTLVHTVSSLQTWNKASSDAGESIWFTTVVIKFAKSWPTLCDAMDCSPPGSSGHAILQARILEWVAIASSQGIFLTQG